MKEAITKPLKGQEKAKAKGKTDARKAVSRREGVPPRAKVLSDGTTVVGIDIGERHVNLCEIDSDDAVTETRLGVAVQGRGWSFGRLHASHGA